jgi:hypothetical protein
MLSLLSCTFLVLITLYNRCYHCYHVLFSSYILIIHLFSILFYAQFVLVFLLFFLVVIFFVVREVFRKADVFIRIKIICKIRCALITPNSFHNTNLTYIEVFLPCVFTKILNSLNGYSIAKVWIYNGMEKNFR